MSEQQQELPKKELSLDLEQIKGLGEKSIPRLNLIGYHTIRDLAVGNAVEIAAVMPGKSSDWVYENLVIQAKAIIKEYDTIYNHAMTSRQARMMEQSRKKIKTGVAALDDLLGGGIETRCITEFYGKFGSGKSQLCFTLSVLATLPEEEGGLNGNVMYIDAEGTYSGVRVAEIISERKLDPEIEDRIYKERPESASYLESYVENISKEIVEKNIKLVIVDSIIILHRQEYIGREQLSRRQQKLSRIMNQLLKAAESYNIAVVITNQISSDPGADPKFHEEVDHATGGNVIAHASSHRIHLERFGKKIKATMVDSPRLGRTECLFILEPKGIDKYVVDNKKKD